MKLKLLSLISALFIAGTVNGQIVFSFDSGSLYGTNTYANVSISAISTKSSILGFSNSTGWSSAIEISGASNFFKASSQSLADDAVYFTITTDPGYVFNISSVTFDARSTSTSAANIGFSLSGSSIDLSSSYSNNSTITTLTSTALNINLVGNNTFAIQGWNASGSYKLQLDNIQINGTTSAIPEPSTYAAILGGLALGVIFIRRRKQKAVE